MAKSTKFKVEICHARYLKKDIADINSGRGICRRKDGYPLRCFDGKNPTERRFFENDRHRTDGFDRCGWTVFTKKSLKYKILRNFNGWKFIDLHSTP